jgi:molybdopterin molybdotransferase
MISVDEAKKLVTTNSSLLPSCVSTLENAIGHVLAEDIYAGIDIPAFNQSAMDGYAFCFDDLTTSKELTIIGEVAAGDAPTSFIQPFHAVRIFTGAAVPPGCDTVVMQEKTEAQ